jgi:hypothetical protein
MTHSRLLELALKIADEAARGVLIVESLPSSDEPEWMDLSGAPAEAEDRLREAVEYLTLRGLLLSKSGNSLVRFTDRSLPN